MLHAVEGGLARARKPKTTPLDKLACLKALEHRGETPKHRIQQRDEQHPPQRQALTLRRRLGGAVGRGDRR